MDQPASCLNCWCARAQHCPFPYILGEVGKTLCYSKLYASLALTPDHVQDDIEYLTNDGGFGRTPTSLPIVLGDPKDDPVVYTAIAAGADVLCARDKKFYAPNVIAFGEKHDLSIMDEVALLSRLRQG